MEIALCFNICGVKKNVLRVSDFYWTFPSFRNIFSFPKEGQGALASSLVPSKFELWYVVVVVLSATLNFEGKSIDSVLFLISMFHDPNV